MPDSKVPQGKDIESFIKTIHAEIGDAVDARSSWMANQEKWWKKRYGIRKKASFPWVGASNLHLPLQEKTIYKMKPQYVSTAWSTQPLCDMETEDLNIALELTETLSWHFDWLVRVRMDAFKEVCLMTDKMLAKGFCIVKTIYDYREEPRPKVLLRDEMLHDFRTEMSRAQAQGIVVQHTAESILQDPMQQEFLLKYLASKFGLDSTREADKAKMDEIISKVYSGAESLKFTVNEVVRDAPRWVVLDPEDIIVPPDTQSVFDLEDARWIDHRYEVTPQELVANITAKGWDKETVNELLRKRGIEDMDVQGMAFKTQPKMYTPQERDETISLEETLTGVTETTKTSNFIVHEVCMWYDEDGDGIEERHILEYAEECLEKKLRFIFYPYDMVMWPYVKMTSEVASEKHYSPRGKVELLDPIATAINIQHNQKINRQTLATTPILLYAPGQINPNNIKFVPGQPVPVQPPVNQNASWMIAPSSDGSYMNEEAILKAWAEELVASPDFGVSSPTNTRGGNSARTAREVTTIASERNVARGFDMTIFQASLQRLFQRTWELYLQFGPEQVVSYTDSTKRPVVVNKSDVRGRFRFVPSGRFGSTDPVLEAQKVFRRFEMLRGDPWIEQKELRRQFLMADNPRIVQRLLQDPVMMAPPGTPGGQQASTSASQGFDGGNVDDQGEGT